MATLVRKSSSFIWQGAHRLEKVRQPGFSQRTELADIRRHFRNLHNCEVLHECTNVDLLDDQHGEYYTTAVEGEDIAHPSLVAGTGITITPNSPNPSDITIAATADVPDPASSVVSETAYGQSQAVGTSENYARQDHTHGTPSGYTQAQVDAAIAAVTPPATAREVPLNTEYLNLTAIPTWHYTTLSWEDWVAANSNNLSLPGLPAGTQVDFVFAVIDTPFTHAAASQIDLDIDSALPIQYLPTLDLTGSTIAEAYPDGTNLTPSVPNAAQTPVAALTFDSGDWNNLTAGSVRVFFRVCRLLSA